VGGRLTFEGLAQATRPGPGVVLVDDVQRCPEPSTEGVHVDAADAQDAVGVALGRGRPHGRVEGVRVGRLGEPVWGEGVSGHGVVLSPGERKRRFSLGERTRFGP
jgi:hypothetical protein